MKKYIILNVSELDDLNFNELTTTSKNTARKNVAEDKAIVSYEGTKPDSLSSKKEYTIEELKTIIDNISNGWYEEE
tara:strand:- start:778 stop:1005 length:228 start_codon:yes stop_codon:yes gene_type:complete